MIKTRYGTLGKMWWDRDVPIGTYGSILPGGLRVQLVVTRHGEWLYASSRAYPAACLYVVASHTRDRDLDLALASAARGPRR